MVSVLPDFGTASRFHPFCFDGLIATGWLSISWKEF
jgi:hypothetical protein